MCQLFSDFTLDFYFFHYINFCITCFLNVEKSLNQKRQKDLFNSFIYQITYSKKIRLRECKNTNLDTEYLTVFYISSFLLFVWLFSFAYALLAVLCFTCRG
jgi:hypothetical protein